jgi:hypothetical protein
MSKVLQERPNADAQLAHRLADALHRAGMRVQTCLPSDRETGDRMVTLLAVDQTTGERIVATGPDWSAAATELGREIGIELRQ